MDGTRQRPSLVLTAGLLAVVCGLAYWNSFGAELILDNVPIVLQDPRLRAVEWQRVREILAFNYWWPSGDSNLYRPVTTLSFWFNYSVLGNGGDATGYHAINLLLHWLNAVLAFVLVRDVTRSAWVALASAAVFACHPLTVESVTNVVGRADLLAGASLLAGLCLYRAWCTRTGSRRWWWLVALGVVYAAGVFSKESAVVLPALLLLHEVLYPAVSGRTRLETASRTALHVWPAYASLLPGAVLLLWARRVVFGDAPVIVQFGGDNPVVNATFLTGAMTAVKVAGYYLALVVWPARLSCDYSFAAVTLFGWTLASGQDLHAWLGLACLLVMLAVAAVCWRRQPAITFFLGLAGIAFLPTSNLLFPIGAIMAERFMYVPVVGLSAAAVLLVSLAGQRLIARASGNPGPWAIGRIALAAAVVAALSARTVQRNDDWTSSMRLWSSAAQVVPDSYKVYKALALATMEADPTGGRADEAIALAGRSIAIIEQADLPLWQQPVSLFAEAGSYRLRKAQLRSAQGDASGARAEIARALTLLERGERVDRDVNRVAREAQVRAARPPGEVYDRGSAFLYRTLTTAYLGAGDPLRAAAAAEYLQRISPAHFDPHYMRGVAEAASAQFEEGRDNPREVDAHLERAGINLIAATILNPAHRESWSLLAKVYQYVAPTPTAVVVTSSGGTLNRENPAVRRHVPLACAQLLAQLRAAGQRDVAAALRQRMITDLGVPAAVLDSAPGLDTR